MRSLLMKGAANVTAERFYPYYVQIYDFDPAGEVLLLSLPRRTPSMLAGCNGRPTCTPHPGTARLHLLLPGSLSVWCRTLLTGSVP